MLNIQRTDCTGCQQCEMTCPKNAITFVYESGFLYPLIDEKKCISCGLCEKKCPAINNSETYTKRPQVYAAWTQDAVQRVISTSGGICYELSKYIIEKGGNVAGVVWDDDYKDARYEIINNMSDLKKISQSKYFQPRLNSIYKRIKDVLENGESLLFIGPACYCEALRLYLDKDYDNLYLCDFICRGYTSQIYHKKRIEFLENKFKSKLSYIQYKNKKEGWINFGTLFHFNNGKDYFIRRDKDPYEKMFIVDDYNTRPSCFDCKYRTYIRKSDITVGDFWGIKNVSPNELKNGVSAVLINSNKGKSLFDSIANNVYFEKRDIVEVEAGNKALRESFIRKTGADVFFDDLERYGIGYIEKKYALNRNKSKISIMLDKIKELLKCNIFKFIKYNFFCSSVIREKNKYIIPYIGSNIKIQKGAHIYLKDNLYLNTIKHGNTKEEMYLTINKGAEVRINGVSSFGTGSTIDVLSDSVLEIGSCDTNVGVVIVCSNHIKMGYDVQIGRGVVVYDSNHHKTGFNNQKNLRPLIIGNHVWLCTGVTIAKGVKIGTGSICGINSTIMSNVKEHCMVMGNPARTVMADVEW